MRCVCLTECEAARYHILRYMAKNIDQLEATVSIDTTAFEEAISSIDGELTRIDERVGAIDEKVNNLPSDGGDGSGDGYGEGSYGEGSYGGPEEIKAAVKEVIDAEYGDALDGALGRMLIPARKVGPAPRGDYHTASMWGLHFKTDRKAHIGSAVVDADEAGTMTVQLGAYDGADNFELVEGKQIDVEEGVNEVDLDFEIPAPGSYLLARRGNLPLRRGDWSGWDSQSREGIELVGGSKPGDWDKPNSYWYYFYQLSIAADKEAH